MLNQWDGLSLVASCKPPLLVDDWCSLAIKKKRYIGDGHTPWSESITKEFINDVARLETTAQVA